MGEIGRKLKFIAVVNLVSNRNELFLTAGCSATLDTVFDIQARLKLNSMEVVLQV